MRILFEYKCSKCDEINEHYVERGDVDPQLCPKCNGLSFRIISSSAFTFKEGHGKGTSGGHLMRFATRNKNGI